MVTVGAEARLACETTPYPDVPRMISAHNPKKDRATLFAERVEELRAFNGVKVCFGCQSPFRGIKIPLPSTG